MSREISHKPGEAGYNDSAHMLRHLQLVPLAIITLLMGKTFRPFIADMCGLSPSHLRRGKNSKLRDSTSQKILEFAENKCHSEMSKKGWSEPEIEKYLNNSPSKASGAPRPYGDFIYGLQVLGANELPLTIKFAEEVDVIIIRLLDAHVRGDLESFKLGILSCNWGDGIARSAADQNEADQRLEDFRMATSWEDTLGASQQVIDNIVLCLFAALDVEHGLTYFKDFEPRPLFLLIHPKLNSQVNLESLANIPSRNFVYQPVRRLLELSHAMMVFSRDQHWPKKPAGRAELGIALKHDDQYVGNFFDGTRKMNVRVFEGLWATMCATVAKRDPFYFPLPIVMAALFWQSSITRHPNQKLKSIILPSEESYTRFWRWHHQNWASQLKLGSVGWPAWMDD